MRVLGQNLRHIHFLELKLLLVVLGVAFSLGGTQVSATMQIVNATLCYVNDRYHLGDIYKRNE